MAVVSSSVKRESSLTYLRDVENTEPPSLSPRKCLVNVHYYHQQQHYLGLEKAKRPSSFITHMSQLRLREIPVQGEGTGQSRTENPESPGFSPFQAPFTAPCWKEAEPSRQGQCLRTADLTLTSNLFSGLQVRPST